MLEELDLPVVWLCKLCHIVLALGKELFAASAKEVLCGLTVGEDCRLASDMYWCLRFRNINVANPSVRPRWDEVAILQITVLVAKSADTNHLCGVPIRLMM
jgi:hypothetical protein